MEIKEILKDIFPEGSEESEVISECYNLITGTAATTSGEAKTHMLLLDHMRLKMSTIYFLLCRNISQVKKVHQKDFDNAYTRLVKIGRPSNAAIEAELRSTSADYVLDSQKIEELEQVKDLVSSYIKGIDSSKQTTMEVLKDSRRLD